VTSLYTATLGFIMLMYAFHRSLNDPFFLGKLTVQVPLFIVSAVATTAAVMILGWRQRGQSKVTTRGLPSSIPIMERDFAALCDR